MKIVIDYSHKNNDFKPFSMEEYISILNQALEEIEIDNVISHEELNLQIEKW